MSVAKTVSGDGSNGQQCPFKHSAHDYLRYFTTPEGERSATTCGKIYADLQSCHIKNYTGSIVLRYLMIDIDAKNSNAKWLNEDGALDWQKIHTHLSSKFPKIHRQIEYVTKSYSKKGIHLIIGFTALPLEDSTKKMQSSCIQIQNYIIKILNNEGLGADEGAKGLCRYFSTFHNKGNVLHHNNILTKTIDNERKKEDKKKRTPHLLNLLKACKKYAKQLELTGSYRLYNHATVELKIAKLYLYTLGLRNVDPIKILDDNLTLKSEFVFKKCIPFEDVTLSLKQIEHISGLTKVSLRELDFFSCEAVNNLWNIDFNFDGSVTLSAKNVSTIAKRILRASKVISGHKEVSKRIDPQLIEPGLVQRGERNFVICSWALAYKWAGYDEDDVIIKIKSLVKSIPGYEFSKSCRDTQVDSVVHSVFKHKEELHGIKPNFLPKFMLAKNCTKNRQEVLGRNPAPLLPAPSLFPDLQKEEKTTLNPVGPTRASKIDTDLKTIIPANTQKSDIKKIDKALKIAPDLSNRLYVVRRNNRIGIFNSKDELILCVTNSYHFRLYKLFKELKLKVNHDVNKKSFIHPRKSDKKRPDWHKKIDNANLVIRADNVCGKVISFTEKKIEFKNKKDIEENFVSQDDFNIPF